MNAWLFFPSYTKSIDHELAIRRFCPARIEQEQGGEWDDHIVNEIDQPWSPYDALSPGPCMEEDEQIDIDSFINIDAFDNYDNKVLESQQGFQFDHNLHSDDEGINEILEMVSEGYEDGGVAAVGGGGADHHGVDEGLELVHSLLACAEAMGCRNTQLADSILRRVWSSANCYGDSLQRVSYWFAMGLKSRLSNLQNVSANGAFVSGGMSTVSSSSSVTKEEKMEVFHLFHQTTPYVAFGFMAANEAIIKAGKGNDVLHIIDMGMQHCLQWPSLIRTLAQQPEGPPKKLRITGLIKPDDNDKYSSQLETAMKELEQYAAALGVPLELNTVAEPEPATPSYITKQNLDVREGEALFVNSIMHLHKYVKESRGSLKAVLTAVKKLGPTLVTVVEQDANHNGPFFLGRFLESLHYYSAIFDSLEASLPRSSLQRMKIERGHFGEEIRNIVAYEGSERIERHERADQWRRQLGRSGFQVVGMKSMSQARMMLSVYGCDGYTLASDKGCLLLGWKGKPIMLASAWQLAKTSN